MYKVSIIVPVYNTEKYLKRCLNSLVNQSYKNIEIILINDGSTDKSYDIMKKFAINYSNIKIFDQKNKGAGETRNKGVIESSGDYVTFVDSDDSIDKFAIEKMVNALKKNTDIVIGGLKIFKNKKILYYIPKNNIWDEFKLTSTAFKLYRKPYIKNRFEFLKMNVFEDLCFNLNTYSHTKNIEKVCEPLYNVYENPNSVTANIKSKKLVSLKEILTFIYNNVNIEKYDKKLFNYFLMKTIIYNSMLQIYNGSIKDISKLYKNDFDFINQKNNVYFYWNKNESFSINFLVNNFILFTKLKIYKVLFCIMKILKIKAK